MKNTLIINGHPNKESFCTSLANKYYEGARQSEANCAIVNLSDLEFDPILRYGYEKRTELEPDLLETWDKIQKADHLVWVYPNWWGTYPALLKGFIDRLFLPGFAFEKYDNSIRWGKLLKGKTAHIIVTMDSPGFFYKFFLKSPGHNSMKRSILSFVGIKTTKTTNFRIVKTSTEEKRNKWLNKAFEYGINLN
ncbi:MAG: NAD(P)H-dependent oxidoreductase [Salinivirgaceae bacterium]|jgi:NAD(P)H dehydrogenase (quinone)|nr:NAD(P)H-dependent oxidoreductase [Salinivirgaceae bacterium]